MYPFLSKRNQVGTYPIGVRHVSDSPACVAGHFNATQHTLIKRDV